MRKLGNVLEQIGILGFRAEARLGQYLGMLYLTYAALKGALIERGRGRRQVLRIAFTQLYFTAVEPLPVFLFTALVFGFVVTVEADRLLPKYGLGYLVPTVIVTSLVREVSPLVIAMILIARSGTAIATELGYMRLNQEIDALELAGVNVDYFVVFPRILGVTLAAVSLMIAFSAVALVGGFALGEVVNLISLSLLLSEVVGALTPQAIGYAVLKGTLFGLTIAAVNCYHGLNVAESFTAIPKANVRGVVHSLLFCFTANALISVYAIL